LCQDEPLLIPGTTDEMQKLKSLDSRSNDPLTFFAIYRTTPIPNLQHSVVSPMFVAIKVQIVLGQSLPNTGEVLLGDVAAPGMSITKLVY